jgi:hypothetical protein
MRILVAAIVITWLNLVPAFAETTGQLLTMCESYERNVRINGEQVMLTDISSGECYAYFTAIHDLAFLHLNNSPTGSLPHVCPPTGPKKTQFIRIFTNYARSHPETHHQGAIFGVLTALYQAFPCP